MDEGTTQGTLRLPPTELSKDYEAARSRSHLSQNDPDHETYCAERAKLLLGSYRRNDANDPDSYVTAIMMVLSQFPRAIVEFATDARTGIQSQEKFKSFPPNSGEVSEFCDAEIKRIQTMAKPAWKFRRREYVPPPSHPGCRANWHIFPTAPRTYAAAVAFSQDPTADPRDWKFDEHGDGIWLNASLIDAITGKRGDRGGMKQLTDSELRAHYGKREAEAARQQ